MLNNNPSSLGHLIRHYGTTVHSLRWRIKFAPIWPLKAAKSAILVGVTGFEPAASTSQRNLSRFFPWFTRLFGAFESEIDAFGCSYKHCFHVVRSCRWSKLWSSPFRWDMDAIGKSRIRLRINSFSAVIIPYLERIVKSLLSTLKNCIAAVKEKLREKSPILFSKKCWTSSLFCGMLLC